MFPQETGVRITPVHPSPALYEQRKEMKALSWGQKAGRNVSPTVANLC